MQILFRAATEMGPKTDWISIEREHLLGSNDSFVKVNV